MKKCQNCNQIFENTKKFCNKCGKPLMAMEGSFPLKKQEGISVLDSRHSASKSLKLRLGITIGSIIAILVAVIVFFNFHTGTLTDIDGNVYQTIKIGNQVWTIENLRTTKFNDGSAIPQITDALTPGYCYYNINTTNIDSIKKFGTLYNWNVDSIKKFGALYNWYAVDTKRLAPHGWHVPTDAEWTILENYLIANGYNWDGTTTGNKIAKSLASKSGWNISKINGTIGDDLTKNNRSGFSALPGGYRGVYGKFYSSGLYARWWSSTQINASDAYIRFLDNDIESLSINDSRYGYSTDKNNGYSVRLVRDN
jgi:Fibrobacter succinogenes major domain (Fib_succ_major).